MNKKRDLSKLTDSTPLSPDAELPRTKLVPRTIRFSEEDEADVDRIDDYLRERGFRRTDATKIIRLALRVAFREISDDELTEVYQDIKTKYQRGAKKPLAT